MRKIILSFAACLAFAAYGQKPVQDTRAMDTFIDQLMGKMTLDEKIGQLNLSGGGVPGILSGVLLSIGRVIGESAALIYTMGTYVNDSPTLLSQGTSLAVHIYNIMSSEQPNFELACAISIVILVFVFMLNLLVKLMSRRFNKAWY